MRLLFALVVLLAGACAPITDPSVSLPRVVCPLQSVDAGDVAIVVVPNDEDTFEIGRLDAEGHFTVELTFDVTPVTGSTLQDRMPMLWSAGEAEIWALGSDGTLHRRGDTGWTEVAIGSATRGRAIGGDASDGWLEVTDDAVVRVYHYDGIEWTEAWSDDINGPMPRLHAIDGRPFLFRSEPNAFDVWIGRISERIDGAWVESSLEIDLIRDPFSHGYPMVGTVWLANERTIVQLEYDGLLRRWDLANETQTTTDPLEDGLVSMMSIAIDPRTASVIGARGRYMTTGCDFTSCSSELRAVDLLELDGERWHGVGALELEQTGPFVAIDGELYVVSCMPDAPSIARLRD